MSDENPDAGENPNLNQHASQSGIGDQPMSLVRQRVLDAAVDLMQSSEGAILPEYLHSVLCQINLPRNTTTARSFERTSGQVSIKIKAGELYDGLRWIEQPLPYGSRPRLVLVHVCSQAVRTKSRDVEVGKSAREFLGRLGIEQSTGGKNGSYTQFRKQMLALAACEMLLAYPTPRGMANVKAPPITKFETWYTPNDKQAIMWPGVMSLSQEFYDSLRDHAVPLRPEALAAIKHSSLALDIYAWLANRLCRVRNLQGTKVFWANLREQFGQEYADPRNFRKKFLVALKQALLVYPDARVEEVPSGFLLKPSPPPIPKTMALVGHPHGLPGQHDEPPDGEG